MYTLKHFVQSDLIKRTGTQFPDGICLGLVVQWLISIKNSNENQFWKDMDLSLADGKNVPLLGAGYARQAIEYQDQWYGYLLGNDPESHHFVMEILAREGLTPKSKVNTTRYVGNSSQQIARILLSSDHRYSKLRLDGGGANRWAHAIGCFRNWSMVGKSSTMNIFDPNIGKFTCSGEPEITAVLEKIRSGYRNLETYEILFYL